jgi:putative ABC transport system permease protein
MSQQASEAMIGAELGGGQYWHERYDPQDPLDLPDAHGPIPSALDPLVSSGKATPILAVQGFMYAGGSFRPVLLKGIDPSQRVLSLPAAVLIGMGAEAPALIGNRMARDTGLKVGDVATVRWRDARGTFDAEDIRIVRIMSTTVQTVDS